MFTSWFETTGAEIEKVEEEATVSCWEEDAEAKKEYKWEGLKSDLVLKVP